MNRYSITTEGELQIFLTVVQNKMTEARYSSQDRFYIPGPERVFDRYMDRIMRELKRAGWSMYTLTSKGRYLWEIWMLK